VLFDPASAAFVTETAGEAFPATGNLSMGTFKLTNLGAPVAGSSDAATALYADTKIPKSLVDAAGDLLVGTANDTVGRLAKGTALQQLRVNAGATGLEWFTP